MFCAVIVTSFVALLALHKSNYVVPYTVWTASELVGMRLSQLNYSAWVLFD